MTRRLSNQVLGLLDASVSVPTYDRAALVPGIVHLGLGNFHRSHQALYLDDLCRQHGLGDWGICGVGLLAQDSRMAAALIPQDCLYTLVERDSDTQTMRVIGSVCNYLHAPSDPSAVLTKMSDPTTRIVSLTVTEGGYYLNQGNGELEQDHPHLCHDLEHIEQAPVSIYGYLTAALDRRRKAGDAPFTILSCDNLQGNGDIVRRLLTTFARLRDPQLATWIDTHVAFPNCMVDRITPATTDDLCIEVQQQLGGVQDAWPVLGETFRQWVIEDTFCNGRPAFEDVGVLLTTDVQPYEMMKIRLLNASHSALAYFGALEGYHYAHDVMANDDLKHYLQAFMDEVTPLVPALTGVDLTQYKTTLMKRFSNPAINDQVARLCMDGSMKLPKFILPSIKEQLAQNGPIKYLSLAVASWCHYLANTEQADINDPMAAALRRRAVAAVDDPAQFLAISELFDETLRHSSELQAQFSSALRSLQEHGVRGVLHRAH